LKVTAEYNLAKLHPNIAKEIFIPENEFKDTVDSSFLDINRRNTNKPNLLIIDKKSDKLSLDGAISDGNGLFALLPSIFKNGIKKEGSCLCLT
jgi:hypothetical protein